MVWVLFSDVHGNFHSLEHFFMETQGIAERYFCLGDIVNDGSTFDDNRCIGALRENMVLSVRGNHEDRMLQNPESVKKIYPENAAYVKNLRIEEDIHGTYRSIHAPSGKRIFNATQAEEEFQRLQPEIRILFFGHSHQPGIFSQDIKGRVQQEEITAQGNILRQEKRYMINPGGVGLYLGMPRTYMIFDEEKQTIELKQINP